MKFLSVAELIKRPGLRLVLVQGAPSPWGQAVKAMMEYKGLEFAVAPQIPGAENSELVAWAGVNSGPVVAWNDGRPMNRWNDILFLLERLAPQRPLVLDAPLSQALAAYRWPGNLRQLHNALRTAVALLGDGELQIGWAQLPDDLAADLQAARARRPPEQLADEEADLRLQQAHSVARMVEVCHGNLSEAARRLGISRNTLYRKLGPPGRSAPG